MTQTEDTSKTGEDSTHRIVVGVDGSPTSISALEWAARQAQLTNFPLEIVMMWEWPTSYGWSTVPMGFDPAADCDKMLEPVLARLRGEFPRAVVTWKIVEGHPAPFLVEESLGADLLVVGSRGHGAFAGMLLGSTSEYCAARSRCPVVVVRGHDSE